MARITVRGGAAHGHLIRWPEAHHKRAAPMLFKNIGGTLQDVDQKKGIVTHWWNALGNLDSDGDRILAGAYEKTIAERGPEGSNRIKFLWQHDPWEPIGAPKELREDPSGPGPEGGLYAVTKIEPTTRGRDALILYQGGVLTEHSVGIDILRRADDDRSNIIEVKLWEGSVVTWGANALTPMVDLKSMAPDTAWQRINEHMRKMRKCLRQPLTDETAEQMELALATMEGHITEIEKHLAPPNGTPDANEPEFGKLLDDLVDRATGFKAPADDSAPPNGTQKDGTPQTMEDWLAALTQKL